MTDNIRFKKLLHPSHIGQIKTRNRIIKTAAGTSFIEADTGYVGEQAKAFYETLAKGGVGLIIVESCSVEYPLGAHHPPVQFRLHDDKLIPSFSELVDAVHKHDCPIFLQLIHSGSWNPTGFLSGRHDAKCSSALTKDELPGPDFVESKGMTISEVEETIEMFIKAADRAHKAGFDGVEINAATCTLPNSFLSRVFNKRQDKYGIADLESRARFLTDIVIGTKKRFGPNFAITVLINGAEYGANKGSTLEESKHFARLLQDAGADAIQIRTQGYGDYTGMMNHPDRLFYPEPFVPLPQGLDWSHKGAGATVPLVEAIKKVVSIPVFTAGRLDPILGEKLLQEGKIDFVAMTRRLLADPELPNKLATGRLEDIIPCIGCLYCLDVRYQNNPVRCRVNAALGHESEYVIKPVDKKKKIVVVGGGPAGMEAARVAALRGHEVTLFERENKLGGAINLAALVKDLELNDLLAFVCYLKTQITKAGVKIMLGKDVNYSVIVELKPDAIILATGGIPTVVDIPGIEKDIVLHSSALYRKLKLSLRVIGPKMLQQLTKFWMPIGKRVIIIGGAIQGCELAEFLVKRGRKVTIVDTSKTLGIGLTKKEQNRLFKWFDIKGVALMTEVIYKEITDKGLSITTKIGERKTLQADNIILAIPLQANTLLQKDLHGKVPEIYSIGDCEEPRLIADAIADACRIAYFI